MESLFHLNLYKNKCTASQLPSSYFLILYVIVISLFHKVNVSFDFFSSALVDIYSIFNLEGITFHFQMHFKFACINYMQWKSIENLMCKVRKSAHIYLLSYLSFLIHFFGWLNLGSLTHAIICETIHFDLMYPFKNHFDFTFCGDTIFETMI